MVKYLFKSQQKVSFSHNRQDSIKAEIDHNASQNYVNAIQRILNFRSSTQRRAQTSAVSNDHNKSSFDPSNPFDPSEQTLSQ